MQTHCPTLRCADGSRVPSIGFGTARLGNCGDLVARAINLGHRHIDTAWKYGSEEGVGDGLARCGVPRANLFVTTKVSHEFLRAADFARSLDESLTRLRTDYVDQLLVHWPSTDGIPLAETMDALARAKRAGKTRYIGVANFNIALLEQARSVCPEPLDTLQAEYHPYLDQTKVLGYCEREGLVFMAYCPLARGRLTGDPVLGEIARTRGKTLAQIALRWLVQQRSFIVPIPRSGNPAHIAEGLAIFDFQLTPDEMAQIFALKRPDGRIANPKGRAPAWD